MCQFPQLYPTKKYFQTTSSFNGYTRVSLQKKSLQL
jgi:hypothetical protein